MAKRVGLNVDEVAAKTIIEAREKFHLTQAQFAELVGVNERTLKRWELEENKPRDLQMVRIAKIIEDLEEKDRRFYRS